jgi:hypothetical protein
MLAKGDRVALTEKGAVMVNQMAPMDRINSLGTLCASRGMTFEVVAVGDGSLAYTLPSFDEAFPFDDLLAQLSPPQEVHHAE